MLACSEALSYADGIRQVARCCSEDCRASDHSPPLPTRMCIEKLLVRFTSQKRLISTSAEADMFANLNDDRITSRLVQEQTKCEQFIDTLTASYLSFLCIARRLHSCNPSQCDRGWRLYCNRGYAYTDFVSMFAVFCVTGRLKLPASRRHQTAVVGRSAHDAQSTARESRFGTSRIRVVH